MSFDDWFRNNHVGASKEAEELARLACVKAIQTVSYALRVKLTDLEKEAEKDDLPKL